MSDKEGKWLPYDQDGSQHDCKKEKKPKKNGQSEMKTKKVRLGTITDDLADKIAQALDNEGIIRYELVGPRLLDVYTEK